MIFLHVSSLNWTFINSFSIKRGRELRLGIIPTEDLTVLMLTLLENRISVS